MTRLAARLEVASLLAESLASLVSKKPGKNGSTNDPAVYAGKIADFAKMRAVVVVSSKGSVPSRIAVKRMIGQHQIYIDAFVLYSDADSDWDEIDAEALIDQISQAVMDTVQAHPSGQNYINLAWAGPSDIRPTNVGGTEYSWEQILLDVS